MEAQLIAEQLTSARLLLEPLRIEQAEEAARAFNDPDLHTFIGGAPAGVEELRIRFARQVVGRSPDGTEDWLNWMVRWRDRGDRPDRDEIVGTVQATVRRPVAEIAWVVARSSQRQGIAIEAARTMTDWLRHHGVDTFVAHIHPDHHASMRVAGHLGLSATDVLMDGEVRWTS